VTSRHPEWWAEDSRATSRGGDGPPARNWSRGPAGSQAQPAPTRWGPLSLLKRADQAAGSGNGTTAHGGGAGLVADALVPERVAGRRRGTPLERAGHADAARGHLPRGGTAVLACESGDPEQRRGDTGQRSRSGSRLGRRARPGAGWADRRLRRGLRPRLGRAGADPSSRRRVRGRRQRSAGASRRSTRTGPPAGTPSPSGSSASPLAAAVADRTLLAWSPVRAAA